MGEAKRRKRIGLSPKKSNNKSKYDDSPRLFDWLPITINQRDNLIKLKGSDIFGIGSKGIIICSGIFY